MSRDANPAFARTLVDEWARAGVTEAVLAPGSRSTPLALALAGDSRLRLHVFLDERSAAFFALGAAKASRRPVVVLCTSGTAAAELFPAVVEARHSRTPLLVCTADRPPELRDTGAGQTIDQVGLFGSTPRWFVEVGTPDADTTSWWRSLASRAFAEAVGPPAGPVHLNLAFRDPLVPVAEPGGASADVAEPTRRPGGQPWTVSAARLSPPHTDDVDALVDAVGTGRRGVLMVGWGANVVPAAVQRFSAAAGWPVLADPLSGVRAGDGCVSTYDALLRDPAVAAALRPDVVVRVGAPLTNKAAVAWADDSVPQLLVDPDGAWLDPMRTVSVRVAADPDALLVAASERLSPPAPLPVGSWLETWLVFEAAARNALDTLLDSWDAPFEGRVARDVVSCLPGGATLVVGSSMPVRDVESFVRPRTGLRFLSNRGANGIDGFVSTVLGAAAGGSSPVAALCGDLTFLHDAGGLLRSRDRGLDAVFVVVDNDGGGLFSFLPQAGLPNDTFEQVFATPHGIDLAALAAVHGIPAERVDTAAGLVPAVVDAVKAGGVRVVVVTTDRADNVSRHRQVWQAVADAVVPLSRPGTA
ncbi:MAG: 2-succinyl-5-enolpyruvyl-6-hydroxy-3-cyclohexene-1-carboxylic-acid synthase [Acidimicrobiales bacterium]